MEDLYREIQKLSVSEYEKLFLRMLDDVKKYHPVMYYGIKKDK